MTIAELFAAVLGFVGGLLGRIVLAFERTFNLIGERKLGDLVLSDIGIVAVIVFFGLGVLLVLFVAVYVADRPWREAHRDDD